MVNRYPVIPAGELNNSYARLAEQVDCIWAWPEVLDCLRGVSVDKFLRVLEKRPSVILTPAREYPDHVVQDGDFYRGRHSKALRAVGIARVPTIIGTSSARSRPDLLNHLTLW
jgi:hypothetical protein